MASSSKRESGVSSGIPFSVVSFHVGDIYSSDGMWNLNRWEVILDMIEKLDADIVILHEVTAESTAFFDKLLVYDYDKTVPYLRDRHDMIKKDNWDVIYCKFPITIVYYIPISKSDGLSCFRCTIP